MEIRSFPKYNIIQINQNTILSKSTKIQRIELIYDDKIISLKPGQKKTKIMHLLVSYLGSIQLITHGIKPIPIPLPNIKIHTQSFPPPGPP